MHWIIGVSDASSLSIGRILSPMMWFGHIWDNRCCQTLFVNGACPSLVICAVPTFVKTTPELSGPAFGSSQRLVTKNLKTEANLAEKGWGRSAPAQLRPGDDVDRPAWRLLMDADTFSWHAPERERVCQWAIFHFPQLFFPPTFFGKHPAFTCQWSASYHCKLLLTKYSVCHVYSYPKLISL